MDETVSLSLQVLSAQSSGAPSVDLGQWVLLVPSAHSSKHAQTCTDKSKRPLSVSSPGGEDSGPCGLPAPGQHFREGTGTGGESGALGWTSRDRPPGPKAWPAGRSPGRLCLQ